MADGERDGTGAWAGFGDDYVGADKEAKAAYGRFNLLIVGDAGVGKSSLVNAIFGRDFAEVGVGMPVTEGLNYYHDEGLGIWDSEGFEIGSESSPTERVAENLREIRSHPGSGNVSVVWYCVSAGSARLTSEQMRVMQALQDDGLPVILVLTKVRWVKNPLTGKNSVAPEQAEFVKWLVHPEWDGKRVTIPADAIVPTSAVGSKGKGVGHGLRDLVATTLRLCPEAAKDSFRIAQQLDMAAKKEMALKVIAASSTAAAAAAAVPLPVAASTALAPIQLGMMAKIGHIYGLELKTMLSSSAVAQMATEFVGKSMARSLVTLIPVFGSVINSSVAATLTGATGEGWRRLCEQVLLGKIDLADVESSVKSFVPNFLDVAKQAMTGKLGRQK